MKRTTSKEVNIVEKKYAFEKRRKRRRPYIPVDQTLPKPRRILKRRITTKHQTVINHWNGIGAPFAEIRKTDTLINPLNKALRECSGDPRQFNFVADKAFLYFSSNYFIYKYRTGHNENLRMYDFLILNQFKVHGQFLISKGYKSWFDLFLKKSDHWLTDYLIRLPKLRKSKDFDPKTILKRVKLILDIRDADFKWQSHLITITNRMMEFSEINKGYSITAALSDFEQYINLEVNEKAKPFWFVSDNFWNMRFKPFIVKVGRFQDERYINEI